MEEEKKPRLTTKGKVRKELTPEALDKLAKAREKANAIRKEGAIRKLEAKVEAHRGKSTTIADNELTKEETEKDIGGNDVPISVPDDDEPEVKVDKDKEKLINPKEEEEEPEVKVVKKKSTKKKTKIIVEQSSSDSDEFEPNDNVVFVKRVSRKKKEPIATEPQVASIAPPEPPQPPQPPPLSRQQKQFNNIYENMSSGAFLRNRFY